MSFYDEVLRCESQRLAPEDEPDEVECEACGSIHYDYLVRDFNGHIVGCDDCITKVYRGEEI